jgi:AraC-like DNA-binding protein
MRLVGLDKNPMKAASLGCSRAGKGDGVFRARSEFVPFGDVVAGHIDYMFHEVARTKRHLVKDTREDLIIGFMRDAAVRAKLGVREIDAPAGSIFFYSTARPVEFRIDTGRISGHTLVLPHKALTDSVANLDDLVGRLLDPANSAVRHLGRYVEFLLSSFSNVSPGPVEHHVRQTLADLTALAVGADRDAAQMAEMRGLRAARLHDVLRAIKAGFVQPSFSASAVARKLGLSPRYIQDLLHETGASFTERVLELRLQKARGMLLDRRNDRLKISEVALGAGFGDVSYFNQGFRRRFGCSPTQARAGQGENSAPDR